MPSEDELPIEIKKLKITTNMEANELKKQGVLNPFYDDYNISPTDAQVDENATQQTKCRRCRLRRRSESIVDDYKTHNQLFGECAVEVATQSPPPPPHPHVARLCKHNTLNKHNLKRTVISTSGDRKIYMREPMLRALQRFCTHKQVRRKQLQSPQEQENSTAAQDQQHSSAEDAAAAAHDKFPARGINDFRDLIEECQSMLEQYKGANKLPEQKTQQFQRHRGEEKPLEMPSLDSISISEQQPSVVARSSVSCSQQAGAGAVTGGSSNVPCDDVTIDELASYFDTFVHIPKKMSTMAEMMYI